MKKIFRIGKYVLILPALILLYLASAFLFSSIPYNTSFVQSTNDPVAIFLHTNGVHTDILVPAVHSFQDWDTLLPDVPAATAYIAFGWGDKGFYLNTPTWGDLTFPTAFKAASGLSTTAMHVSYFKNIPVISEQT
ncbi:MAG: DUF2459 domain-containing protein, partial [Cytophagales bacterium]|nr:DUF2459 domain-containing protein [Cytophaga sp.]